MIDKNAKYFCVCTPEESGEVGVYCDTGSVNISVLCADHLFRLSSSSSLPSKIDYCIKNSVQHLTFKEFKDRWLGRKGTHGDNNINTAP
jgi:hypothetical protein